MFVLLDVNIAPCVYGLCGNIAPLHPDSVSCNVDRGECVWKRIGKSWDVHLCIFSDFVNLFGQCLKFLDFLSCLPLPPEIFGHDICDISIVPCPFPQMSPNVPMSPPPVPQIPKPKGVVMVGDVVWSRVPCPQMSPCPRPQFPKFQNLKVL